MPPAGQILCQAAADKTGPPRDEYSHASSETFEKWLRRGSKSFSLEIGINMLKISKII
jgi:hypothetical protein